MAEKIVERIDKYTVRVEGHDIRATPRQEERLRAMTPEQRGRFLAVMGKTA